MNARYEIVVHLGSFGLLGGLAGCMSFRMRWMFIYYLDLSIINIITIHMAYIRLSRFNGRVMAFVLVPNSLTQS